jgi:hypothetical protein
MGMASGVHFLQLQARLGNLRGVAIEVVGFRAGRARTFV